MEERYSFCINGGQAMENLPYDYKNIGERFYCYSKWLESGCCHTVRFEDLIGENKKQTIHDILKYYLQQSNKTADLNLLTNTAMKAIKPQKSHTFREGKSGGWEKKLTAMQRKEMHDLVGEQLQRLGYPNDE
jgi:hypothetical protein